MAPAAVGGAVENGGARATLVDTYGLIIYAYINANNARIIISIAYRSLPLMFVLAIGLVLVPQASEDKKVIDHMPSLIAETPLEGRMLAMKMASNTLGAIQPDPAIKLAVRLIYQGDPQLLLYSAERVAMEFKIIAIANDYWR